MDEDREGEVEKVGSKEGERQGERRRKGEGGVERERERERRGGGREGKSESERETMQARQRGTNFVTLTMFTLTLRSHLHESRCQFLVDGQSQNCEGQVGAVSGPTGKAK